MIERASRWDGEKGAWIKALRETGFLDGFVVHGWQERAGRLVQDRRRNEQRRKRRTTGGKAAVERRIIVRKPLATLPNPTLPNLTKENRLPPSGGLPSKPDIPKPLTDLQKVMSVYKLVCGFTKDDKTWDKTFFPRYAKSAGALLEFMGSWKDAADCIEDTYKKIKAWNPEASISIDTVLTKHAAEWKKDKSERMGSVKHHGVLPVSRNGGGEVIAGAIGAITRPRKEDNPIEGLRPNDRHLQNGPGSP